jgi:RNA polymerase sigma-70 factor (TIGR02943 family)
MLSLALRIPVKVWPAKTPGQRGQAMTSQDHAGPQALDWNDPSILALRRDMLKFAHLQLRDAGAAEDAVQDALIAAMNHQSGFAGRSALKTWVFAILRNKIIDHLRKHAREIPACELAGHGDEDGPDVEAFFDRSGHWTGQDKPNAWADPESALSQKQFWAVFDACLNHLPASTARVFMMREFLDLDTSEICRELEISTNNCWVILHRARAGLRRCLENNWFGGEPRPC